jgi:hypothetical protein
MAPEYFIRFWRPPLQKTALPYGGGYSSIHPLEIKRRQPPLSQGSVDQFRHSAGRLARERPAAGDQGSNADNQRLSPFSSRDRPPALLASVRRGAKFIAGGNSIRPPSRRMSQAIGPGLSSGCCFRIESGGSNGNGSPSSDLQGRPIAAGFYSTGRVAV